MIVKNNFNYKKLIYNFIISILILVQFNSSLKGYEKYATADFKRIFTRKKLIVAVVNKERVPFFFYNKNGILSGLDIELSQQISNNLGVKLEFNREANSFNELIDIIIDRKADIVISKLSQTLERSQKVLYTKPYVILHHALMFNRLKIAKIAENNSQIIKMVQNYNKDIGVIKNSSYYNYAKTYFPKAKVIEHPDWASLVNAVFQGKVLSAYIDELEIKKIVRFQKNASIKIQTVLLKDTKDRIAIAVHHEDKQLLSWLNIFLTLFNHNYNADKILNKYSTALH